MSIVTKAGDGGTTGLMYRRRVSKADPRIEANGCVDELNAALGVARATATEPALKARLLAFQQELVTVMGELATDREDRARYAQDGYPLVTAAMTARLEAQVTELEARAPGGRGWAMPGGNALGAALDLARTVCRRAERRVAGLHDAGCLANPEVLVYLNRLADLLWLLARRAETEAEGPDAVPPAA